ncbi:MAG: alpha-isopropylmalate synthase regulatory domain-containing protein, partial [Nakamurella sp.]
LIRSRIDNPEDADDDSVFDRISARIVSEGEEQVVHGNGNGPVAAFCSAIGQAGYDVRVLDYVEHALSAGGDARAAAYLECAIGGQVVWGVGIDSSITTASLKAVVSAVNRAAKQEPVDDRR